MIYTIQYDPPGIFWLSRADSFTWIKPTHSLNAARWYALKNAIARGYTWIVIQYR